MELEDLYDEKFNKLNKIIRRRIDEIPEGCYVMMSYALIKNNDKYLLEQATARSNNTLAIPGGHVLAGEDGLTGLKRELKEELNIEITDSEFNLIDTVIYKKQFVDIYISNKPINIKNIKLQEEEIKDAKFVTKKEFIEMINNNEIVSSVYERYKKIEDKIKDW
jgi:8-oxo-dGTP pyrophosphatase MutT (NUDIX family)